MKNDTVMKPASILAFAVAFAAGGGVCLMIGRSERDVALIEEQLVTMRYQEVADHANKPQSLMVLRAKAAAAESRVTADYWLGKYDSLRFPRDSSGNTMDLTSSQLMVAANASYRTAMSEIGQTSREIGMQRLENAIQSYSDVMKNDPQNEDAAFNYEFVIRTREAFAKLPAAAAQPKTGAERASIHGLRGAPPKGSAMDQFKVIIPQRPDERKEDKQPGKGEKRAKKG